MATVTNAIAGGTADTTNGTSYVSGSFTPAASDLLVFFCQASGTVAATPTLTASANGITFTRIINAASNTTTDTQYAFVANQLLGASPSAMTVTFDCSADAATGNITSGARVSGMTKTGLTAILQSAKVENVAGGTAPSTVFGANCQTGNPTLFAAHVNVGTGVTPPTGWTEQVDATYATPTKGGGYDSRDSGFTGTTITLGSTSNGACSAIALELDTSAGTTPQALSATVGFTGAQVRATANHQAATVGFAGTMIRGIGHTLAATVGFTGTLARRTAKGLTSAAVGFTGSMVKVAVRPFTATVSFTGAQSRRIGKSAAATVSFTGAQTRRVSTSLTAATVSFIGTQARRVSHGLQATVSFTGSLATAAVHFFTQSLSATVGFTGSLATAAVHHFTQALSATVGFAGSVTRRTGHAVTATVGFAGALPRRIGSARSATVGFTGSIGRRIGHQLSAALGFLGSLLGVRSGQTAPYIELTIPARLGTLAIPDADRTLTIGARLGTLAIPEVERTLTIPARKDTLEIPEV